MTRTRLDRKDLARRFLLTLFVFSPIALLFSTHAALALEAPASARGASPVLSADASVPATPTIVSPANGAKTTLRLTTVTVAISQDTTGVSVLRGTTVVASRATSDTTSVVFANVPLVYGFNVLRAVSQNETGTATSTPVTIKAVAPVGAPIFLNVFYRKVFYSTYTNITGHTRANTIGVELYVNGRKLRKLPMASWKEFTLRRVPLRYGMNTISIVAFNEFYRKGTGTYKIWRLDVRPNFSTLVLVDKSEFRIYFIKRYKLIAVYPCAIGKPSTPTPETVWRIDSKEYTDPSSAYGPRRMRMFRRVWSGGHYSYVYTAYGIHGTDTPSSIGHMASHGCIRTYNWNILKLFPVVPLHTYVVTRR